MKTSVTYEKLLHDVESPIIAFNMLLALIDSEGSKLDDLFLEASINSLFEKTEISKAIIAGVSEYKQLSKDQKDHIASFQSELESLETKLRTLKK